MVFPLLVNPASPSDRVQLETAPFPKTMRVQPVACVLRQGCFTFRSASLRPDAIIMILVCQRKPYSSFLSIDFPRVKLAGRVSTSQGGMNAALQVTIQGSMNAALQVTHVFNHSAYPVV